jgi:hypothetical protein
MINYTIDPQARLVRAHMSGVTTLVALATHISHLAKDPKFDPSYNLIFEVAQDATFSLLPVEEEFRQLLKHWTSRRKGVKWAFWSPFGVTHTHIQFALGLLDQKDVRMRLFEDEPSALKWLAEGDQ